jgi:predicted nucleotidyltransferase
VERLRKLIGDWKLPTFHASLFGSAARGDGNQRSDIDLLMVRSGKIDAEDGPWRRQLDELADKVWLWTGNHAGVVEVAEADLPRLLEERPPALEEVEQHGIDLAGMPLRKWMKFRA